jgi:nitrogen regulatory protein P-II 1
LLGDGQIRAIPGGKLMKKVEAIIRPFKLDEVKESPQRDRRPGADGDRGQRASVAQKGKDRALPWLEYVVDFLPKVKLEVVVATSMVQAGRGHDLQAAARTGKIGDGKIFVLPVDEVIRIRTGESGEKAL